MLRASPNTTRLAFQGLARAQLPKNVPAVFIPLRAYSSEISSKPQSEIAELAKKNRPISPHMTIYKPQITWYGSITHRVTGAALSAGLYVWAIGYVAGAGMDSASITSTIATLPEAVKYSGKFLLAWPFTYHSLNGVRHLVWDAGKSLSVNAVNKGGWLVVGSSVAGALALAAM